jgi:hypothetical protein
MSRNEIIVLIHHRHKFLDLKNVYVFYLYEGFCDLR